MHYWVLIDHGHMTEDHLKRTAMDMKDGVLYGMDQRWSCSKCPPYGDLVKCRKRIGTDGTPDQPASSKLVQWDELDR
ncbi:MAG: hypothetical protein ACLSUW_07255 [Akkermansia sp.]